MAEIITRSNLSYENVIDAIYDILSANIDGVNKNTVSSSDVRVELPGGVCIRYKKIGGVIGDSYYLESLSPDNTSFRIMEMSVSGGNLTLTAMVSNSKDIYFKLLSGAAPGLSDSDRFMVFKGLNSADHETENWCVMINFSAGSVSSSGDSAYMINRIIAPDTNSYSAGFAVDGYSHNPINVGTTTDERTGRAMKGSWVAGARTTVAVPIASGESAYVSKNALMLAIAPTCYYGRVDFNGKKYYANGLWLMLDE